MDVEIFSMYTLKRIGIEDPESVLFCTCTLSCLWAGEYCRSQRDGLSHASPFASGCHLLSSLHVISVAWPILGERTKYSIPWNPGNILPRSPCHLNAPTKTERLLVGCLVMDTDKNFIWSPCLITGPSIKGSLLDL